MQLMMMYIVTIALADGLSLSIFVSLVSETMSTGYDSKDQYFYAMLVMSTQGFG